MKNIKGMIAGLEQDKSYIILVKREEASHEYLERLSDFLADRKINAVIMAVSDVNSVSIADMDTAKFDFMGLLEKALMDNTSIRNSIRKIIQSEKSL